MGTGWFARRRQWRRAKKQAARYREVQSAGVRRDHVSTYHRANREADAGTFKTELRRAVQTSGARGAEERLNLSVHLHV